MALFGLDSVEQTTDPHDLEKRHCMPKRSCIITGTLRGRVGIEMRE
jgi:hypothetical protein